MSLAWLKLKTFDLKSLIFSLRIGVYRVFLSISIMLVTLLLKLQHIVAWKKRRMGILGIRTQELGRAIWSGVGTRLESSSTPEKILPEEDFIFGTTEMTLFSVFETSSSTTTQRNTLSRRIRASGEFC